MPAVRPILPVRFRWALLLVLALLSGARAFAIEENKHLLNAFREKLAGLGFTAIPLERTEDKRMYALVKINGKVTRWLVDTSIMTSRVSPSLARNLPLAGTNGEPDQDVVLGGLTNLPVQFHILPQLSLGTLTISNTPVGVLSVPGREQFNGVLGLDFLIRNDCLIECAKPTLHVRNWEAATRAGRDHEVSDAAKGIYACRMKLTPVGLQVPAIVDVHRVPLVVGTASFATFLDDSTAVRFKYSGDPTRTSVEGSAQIERTARKFTARTLMLGAFRIGNAQIGIIDLDALNPRSSPEGVNRVAGVLGMEHMMWNFGLIDVGGRQLFLAPTKPR